MKIKKKIFILPLLTSVVAIPFIATSCITSGEDDANSLSISSNKPGTNPPQTTIEKFSISNAFVNLKVKNPDNLLIDDWVSLLNKELRNNLESSFSYNRSSQNQPINIQAYLQISANRMKDIVNQKYLINENNSFSQSIAYDLRAYKVNDKKVKIQVSMYDPVRTTDQLLTKEIELDFVFTLKEFHKLVAPINVAKNKLTSLKKLRDTVQIKPAFDTLEEKVKEAEALYTSRNENASKVNEALTNINEALKNLTDANQNYLNSNRFAILHKEIDNKEEKIRTISNKNAAISSVKSKIDSLKSKVIEARVYITKNMPEDDKIKEFIDQLTVIDGQLDTEIANLQILLNDFINDIKTRFVLKNIDNSSSVLPSTIKTENLEIKSDKKLENSKIDFTITPFDSYGKLLITGKVHFGELSKEFKATVLPFEFKQNLESKMFLLDNLQSEISQIISGKWPTSSVTKEVNAAKQLQMKLTELLSEAESEENKEVLNDKVALLLWADEYRATNNKSTSLKTIKDDFLNKPNGNTFSKLQYMTSNNRWLAIERMIKIFSYILATPSSSANTAENSAPVNPSNLTAIDLSPYKEAKFVSFIGSWFKDYIEKYFNKDSQVTNGQWVLFEFFQPLRTLQILLLLEKSISVELFKTTIEAINRFSKSLSNYGEVQGTGSTAGKRLIDNNTHAKNAFFVVNYLNLYNKNLEKALNDAADYKKWLETTKWDTFAAKLTTPIMVLNFVNAIRLQNNFYNKLKTDKSNLGVDTTDFTSLIDWFIEKYLPINITFDKVNAAKGEELMRVVAVFYLLLATNSEVQSNFLTKLKQTELLKDRTKDNFTQLNSIAWGFAKSVWEENFLK